MTRLLRALWRLLSARPTTETPEPCARLLAPLQAPWSQAEAEAICRARDWRPASTRPRDVWGDNREQS